MKINRMWEVPGLVVLGIGIGGPGLQGAVTSNCRAFQNQEKYQEVFQFMDLLRAGRPATRRFNVNDVPNWNPKCIAGFIYSGGITVGDVNTKVVKRYSPDEVEQSLVRRRGDVFQSFSHISFLYAKGKKQYSEIKFVERPNGVLAVLASWYELEFVSEGGHLKLRKCNYINAEGD